MSLEARPCTLKQAQECVTALHRHHKKPTGHRFSIAAFKEGVLVGVVVVSRPVARMTDQYLVAEVTRLATDGTKNACSFLYSRAARAAEAMGFESIQTFTLYSEPGTSLRAAGWTMLGLSSPKGPKGWNSRKRQADENGSVKIKWEKRFRGCAGYE